MSGNLLSQSEIHVLNVDPPRVGVCHFSHAGHRMPSQTICIVDGVLVLERLLTLTNG